MYRNMSDLLNVINLIAEQQGGVSKQVLKSFFEFYKVEYKEG